MKDKSKYELLIESLMSDLSKINEKFKSIDVKKLTNSELEEFNKLYNQLIFFTNSLLAISQKELQKNQNKELLKDVINQVSSFTKVLKKEFNIN